MPVRTAATVMPAACGLALALLPAAALAQPKPQVLPSCTSSGQKRTLNLNTGTGPLNPPPGRFDPIWRIKPTIDISSTTRGPWFNPPAGSRWVQRSNVGNPVTAPANTQTYYVRFLTPLPGNAYQSLTINGLLGADNNATMRLTNVNATNTLVSCVNCFGTPTFIPLPPKTFFSQTPDLSFGGQFLNSLEVDVTNFGGPSGLLVRAAVNAVCP